MQTVSLRSFASVHEPSDFCAAFRFWANTTPASDVSLQLGGGEWSAAAGDVIENLSAYSNITLRACTIRWNRARGVLLNGRGRIRVEGNTFENAGAAILIESSEVWGESGPVQDVTIVDNTFRDCTHSPMWGQAVIHAVPEFRAEAPVGTPPFHRRLVLRGNRFEHCHSPELIARSFAEIVREESI